MATSYNDWSKFTYSSIQSIIKDIYNKKWLQTNASFPTVLGYATTSSQPGTLETDDAVSLLKGVASESPSIKSLKEYIEKESKLPLECLDNNLLNNFIKISGLSQLEIPLSKENGHLKGGESKGINSEVVLEFLLDRELTILNFMETWQQKWYKQTSNKFQLTAHDSESGGKDEGYMSLTNVSINPNGVIKPLSQLALFGLIPKKIELPKEWGPSVSNSNVATVKLYCIYSQALLIWNNGNKLNYQILGW